jgi:Ca-activated chloride channel homolog
MRLFLRQWFALFGVWPCLATAQSVTPPAPSGDQQFRFSTSVQMVVLQVTVLSSKGAFVRGLRQSNFSVSENAQPQTIQLFSHNDSPVAIGLVIDNSGSMRRKHTAVLAAAKAFARNSNPNDQLFVINFNEKVTFGLPHSESFSANSRDLERAIHTAERGGKTALFDALETGLSHIHELHQDKKALILISDGGDNASSHTLDQIIDDATNSDVVIYTIGLFGNNEDLTSPAFMKRISEVTGGEAFLPKRPSQAANNCKRIAQTIRTEYTLGYAPSDVQSDGKFRTIQVNVMAKVKDKLIARTRSGYTPQPMPTPKAQLLPIAPVPSK